MAEVLRILNKLLTEHFERATERRQKRADEDYDEVNYRVRLLNFRLIVLLLIERNEEMCCHYGFIFRVLQSTLNKVEEGPFVYVYH